MRQFIRDKRTNLVNAAIGALLFMAIPVGIEYWFNRALEPDQVFEYTSIEPMRAEFLLGEKPRLKSYGEIKRTVDLEWVDVLRCTGTEHPETFVFFSSYPTEKNGQEPIVWGHEARREGWIYQGVVPTTQDRTCYIDSTIKACLGMGVCKTQQIDSATFQFKDIITAETLSEN